MTIFCHYCYSAVDEPPTSVTPSLGTPEAKLTNDATYACRRMECWLERSEATTTTNEDVALYARWRLAKADEQERSDRIEAANAPRSLDELTERILKQQRALLQKEENDTLAAIAEISDEEPTCAQPPIHRKLFAPSDARVMENRSQGEKPKPKPKSRHQNLKARVDDCDEDDEELSNETSERQALLMKPEQLKRGTAKFNTNAGRARGKGSNGRKTSRETGSVEPSRRNVAASSSESCVCHPDSKPGAARSRKLTFRIRNDYIDVDNDSDSDGDYDGDGDDVDDDDDDTDVERLRYRIQRSLRID